MTIETLLGGDLSALLANPKFIALILITMAWKFTWYGLALWKTIQEKNKKMFVIFIVLMMLLNDLGIVPIVYLIIKKNKNKTKKKKKK